MSPSHTITVSKPPRPGFLTLDGRSTRLEYWICQGVRALIYGVLFLCVLCIELSDGMGEITDYVQQERSFLLLSMFITGLLDFIFLPVAIRRCHDFNCPGWVATLLFMLGRIPFVGGFFSLISLLVLGCLDGTPGPNKFGPCPKGRGVVIAPPSPQEIRLNLKKLEKLYEKKMLPKVKYEAQKQKLQAELDRMQAELQAQLNVVAPVAEPQPEPAASQGESIEARLAKIKALHEKGVLTEEEYAEQRKRILSEL